MQYIGIKIQNLLKHKDLKQQALATLLGIGPQHLSKKIGEQSKFSSSQVVIAAKFLGVTPDYLKDEKRPFNEGDEIPPDAIAQPTPITTTTDLADLARMMERQVADIAKSENDRIKNEVEVLKESNKQLAQMLRDVTGNLVAIGEIVKDLREYRDGGPDGD